MQICYLKSHTSLSARQAAMLNTLQLVLQRVRRGVTNLRPWSHQAAYKPLRSLLIPQLPHADSSAAGERQRPQGWKEPSWQEPLQPSSPSPVGGTQLHVPVPISSTPCQDLGALQLGPSATPSARSPACGTCPPGLPPCWYLAVQAKKLGRN